MVGSKTERCCLMVIVIVNILIFPFHKIKQNKIAIKCSGRLYNPEVQSGTEKPAPIFPPF